MKRLDLPARLFKPPIVLVQTFEGELDTGTQKQLGDMYIKGSVETVQGYPTFANLRKNFRQLSECDCLIISLAFDKGITAARMICLLGKLVVITEWKSPAVSVFSVAL